MFYVYILENAKNNKFYKGCTKDLKQRLKEHNNGNVKSTKGLRPWKLAYYEAFLKKTDALREEKFLKSGKGKERIKFLLQK